MIEVWVRVVLFLIMVILFLASTVVIGVFGAMLGKRKKRLKPIAKLITGLIFATFLSIFYFSVYGGISILSYRQADYYDRVENIVTVTKENVTFDTDSEGNNIAIVDYYSRSAVSDIEVYYNEYITEEVYDVVEVVKTRNEKELPLVLKPFDKGLERTSQYVRVTIKKPTVSETKSDN